MPHTLDPTGDNAHLYRPAIFSMSHPEVNLRSAQRLTPATLPKPMAAYADLYHLPFYTTPLNETARPLR